MIPTAMPRIETLQHHPANRVDVHILSYLGNPEWLHQCIASLAPEPVNVHLVIGGFPGSIGAARAFAFTLGSAEFVCFMDDDDYLLPNAVQPCLDLLDREPGCIGVYTDTRHLHPDGHSDRECKGPWRPLRQLFYCPEITHLKLMRRSAVMPHLAELARWPTWEEYVLCGLMVEHGVWRHLPIEGAVKRTKPSHESSMRLATDELWRAAMQTVAPILTNPTHLDITPCR